MNSCRSKSLKLVSFNSKHIEVAIEGSSQMGSSALNTVYCCIAKGRKILYSYNNTNTNSHELDSLATLCLENAPPFHKYYFHTVGTRTFGYLIADGHTFFAVVDPSVGNLGILQFLERIKDGFKNENKNGFNESLVPIIKRLIVSLENMPRSTFMDNENCDNGSDGSSSSSKAPLLGKNGSRKKMKERESEGIVEIRDGVRVDIPSEQGSSSAGLSMETAGNNRGRVRRQLSGTVRNRFWRHVKIVIIVDLVICLVLFIVWLGVCRGFQCVGR